MIYFIKYQLSLLAVAMFSLGCNITQQENPQDATQNAAQASEEKLDDAQVNAFATLEQKAAAALNSQQMVLARQLIGKGLQQTQKAGRQYEMYEARFSLLKGKLEHQKGRSTEARRFFGDAMAVFRIRKNASGTFEVRLAQASLEESSGDFAAAQRELDEAQKLISEVNDANLRGEFTFTQAELFASQMKHKDASRLFLEAAEQFHANKNPKREADSFVALASCEESLEKAQDSKNSLNKAYKIYMGAEDKEGAVKALHKLAQFSLRDEKYKTAKEQLKRVEALYLELGKQSDATKVNQHLSSLPE
ncbi:MAG: hypothetical protein JXR76_26440 [Deltaproteobacteria bacterium]|nr:hypothetical protein [Deltaproteobacteria bacterium]